MAKQKSVWGIDIGQCALKAIKLTYDSAADRAVAQSFDFIEHDKILSQPDADPEELIQKALEKFLSRNDVKDDSVVVGMPGQSGLARFVKLPPVEVKKVPEIVMFEARQQIPFPLEDVIWDFQKIGGSGEEEEGFALETEVGIFAIKRDMCFRQLQPFQRAGIEADVVQLAPVSLYNYVAYDHILHGEQPAEGEEQEGDTIVILDIGADKTDVVITDGDMIWLRNLPIGGNHFTRALTKELKLTFAKAEHLKRNATKAPDPKKLYQAMRPVFQDFVGELQRSIGYFSSTHRTNVIQKVIGVGNGFKLPGLQKFLQQNLQYPVEKVSKFNGVTGDEVVGAASFNENLASFCVSYGLALQGLNQTPVQTNLLPKEIQNARLIREKKPWSLVAAALLLFGFVSIFYGNFRVYKAVHAETFNGPVERAKSAAKNFGDWKSKYDSAIGAISSTTDQGKQLIGAEQYKDKTEWIKVLKLINDALPPRVAELDKMELEEVPEVNVEYILAAHLPNVQDWYNTQPDKAKNSMAQIDKDNPPQGEGWVFQILGYTFHKTYEQYLLREVVPRFQTDALRKEGISHAALTWSEVEKEWTPAKGSEALKKANKITKMVQTLAARTSPMGGSGGGSGMMMSGGADMSGGTMGTMGGMGGMDMMMMESFMPEDYSSYQDASMEGQFMMMGRGQMGMPQVPEEKTLMRTDFEILFVWTPGAKPAEAEAAEGEAAQGEPAAQ